MHGANASGRPFTGDYAGIMLYETLHDFGFATSPQSRAGDDRLSSSTAGSPTRSNACRRTTSRCRTRSRTATATSPPISPRCPRAARSSRSAASRTTPRCARSVARRGAFVRAWRRARARATASRSSTAITAAATTPTPAADGGDVRAVFDAIARISAARAARSDEGLADQSPRPSTPRRAATPFDARELLASLPHRAGRLPHFDAAGERALRRQGARPEEARLELLPEERPRAAHRRDDRAGRARRDDGRRAPKARRCCSRTT